MRSLQLIGSVGGPFVLVLAGLLGAGEPSDSRPAPELELAELARTIAKLLQGREADAVVLGGFQCKRHPVISHGPGICQMLARELTRAGVKVDAKAAHLIEGEYDDKIDKKSRRVYIELTCRLIDRRGAKSNATILIKRGLFGEEALIDFLTPAAVVLDPTATPAEREESFIAQNDREQPAVQLQGTRIFVSDKQEYGVEILVKKGAGYAAKKPELTAGYVYVPLEKDEPFAVRLLNNSALDAAAAIHIDGLDVFSFSELLRRGGPAPRWIVAKKQDTVVPGWPIRSGLSHEFLVTEYAKSAVAELNAAGSQVGILRVTFAAVWPKGSAPPEDEKARNQTAVGRGAPVRTPFQIVPMTFGLPRAVLNIRYQR